MDIAEISRAWGWALAILLQLFLAGIGWSVRASFISRAEHDHAVEDLRAEMAAVAKETAVANRRVETLEGKIENLPSRDELHDLNLSVQEMSGRINTVAERLDGSRESMSRVHRVLDRVEDYLLKSNGSRMA